MKPKKEDKKMSRQGLRSTKDDDRNVTEEPSDEQGDLDNTLTEMSREGETTSMLRPGGQEVEAVHSNKKITGIIARKLDDLEKRVKKMMEEENKRREKLDTDKEKNLQKKLAGMEAGVNRSLEITTGITQTLEERNTRIEAQVNRLEAQQTRMMERLNTEELPGATRTSNIKYVLPEFRGDTSPIRYMHQIKQYWEAVEPKESDTHYLIEVNQNYQNHA